MDNGNLNASHLAWCGLVALQNARADGEVSSPAQENLFLVRWLALAEKQRRFMVRRLNRSSWEHLTMKSDTAYAITAADLRGL